MTEIPGHHRIRKRRRGEAANPANTLDGLVAKRADDRIEIDPDVSTRTCSICGYRGKWISEMIRHKRVHTNERPFRCKYCSRTSKWKADLKNDEHRFFDVHRNFCARRKTHGIRVVSKYSRSKTFHSNISALNMTDCISESNEKRRNCIKILTDDKDNALRCRTPKILRLPSTYRCVICSFEQESILVLMSHLKNAHEALPYECHSCGSSFMDAHSTMKHFIERTTCKRTDLKINIAPPCTTKNNFYLKPSFAFLDESAKRVAQELFRKDSTITSSAISTKNLSENATLPSLSTIKYETKQSNIYDNNRNEKMCVMEEHMRMHKTNPSLPAQSIDEMFAHCAESRMKVTMDGIAKTEQALSISRYFDFGTVLSVLKQQAVFDPLLSIQVLTSMPALLSERVSSSSSAFKQVTPILEEIIPVAGFTFCPELPENKTNDTEVAHRNITRKEEDDFIDVVQFDD